MLKKFSGFDSIVGLNAQQLPTGAYELLIRGASLVEGRTGQYVKVDADIASGEYKGFFETKYSGIPMERRYWGCSFHLYVPSDDGSTQDYWTKRRFRTFITALEDSNPGYRFDWDESKFCGLMIGGVFNIREYRKNDGSIGRATSWAYVCSIEDVRQGNYSIPEDKRISDSQNRTISRTEGFSVADDDELPF